MNIPVEQKPLIKHFSLNSLKGLSLKTEWFEGKTLLIHYFTTWCHPCVEQAKALNQVQAYFSSQQQAFNWTGINHLTQKLESLSPDTPKPKLPLKELLALEIQQLIQSDQSNVVVLGICLEKKGCRRLLDFQELNQISYGLWIGELSQRSGLGPFGKLTTLPISYLIDKKGRLRGYYEGVVMAPYLIEEINKIR